MQLSQFLQFNNVWCIPMSLPPYIQKKSLFFLLTMWYFYRLYEISRNTNLFLHTLCYFCTIVFNLQIFICKYVLFDHNTPLVMKVNPPSLLVSNTSSIPTKILEKNIRHQIRVLYLSPTWNQGFTMQYPSYIQNFTVKHKYTYFKCINDRYLI